MPDVVLSSVLDLCDLVVDCPHSTPVWTTSGVVVLRSKNIRGGRLDLSAEPSFTTEEGYRDRVRRAAPQSGDLVLTREAPMGEVCMVPSGLRCCLGQRMVLLRPNSQRVDGHYLLYAIQSPFVQHQILMHEGTGSTVSNLRIPALEALRVPLPERSAQRRIGAILRSLDDKIELNRKMNRTLEEMAQALFKSWFIDFDGHDPADLVASEIGPIPTGWQVRRLADVTSKIGSGATPRGGSDVYVESGTSFIRSQNVYDAGFSWPGLVRIDDVSAAALRGVSVQADDVLINITGDSILRTCVVDPDVLPARVNQHVAILRTSEVPARYLHLWMVRPWTKDFLLGHSAGATRNAITKGHLEGVPVMVPPRDVRARFEDRTTPLFKRLESNRRESRTLAELRDVLLPKLISGELRVHEAEAAIAEVP